VNLSFVDRVSMAWRRPDNSGTFGIQDQRASH